MQPTETRMVPLQPTLAEDALLSGISLSSALVVAGTPPSSLWCSIAATTDDNIRTITRAKSGGSKALADQLNREISVRDVLLHRVEIRTEKPGEYLPACRLVLIDAAGVTYATIGTVPLASWCNLMSLVGIPPYEPPVLVRVMPLSLRSGYKSFEFDFVGRHGPLAADDRKPEAKPKA